MREVVLGYAPRAPLAGYHARQQRRAVIVAHRRAGKTTLTLADEVKRSLKNPLLSPRYAYVAPYRQQAKDISWAALKRLTATIPGAVAMEGELHVTLPGDRRIRLYGADNAEALRGPYLDGVILDEPADIDPYVWTDIIRPMLVDRGGWITWIGTPKGRNAFYHLWERAREAPELYWTLMLPASHSGIISEAELASARADMIASSGQSAGEAAYMREFECDFSAPVEGAIYAAEMAALRRAGRVVDFPQRTTHPLITFWDLGQSDYTCIWLAQLVGQDVLLLAYYSATGKTPAHYAAVCMDWERQYGLRCRAHYLPHDATHRDRSGKTWLDDLAAGGLRNFRTVPRVPDVWIGINGLRGRFNRMWVHATGCGKTFGDSEGVLPSGIDCLTSYHKKIEQQGAMIREDPVHDQYSHGADALRTFAEADMQHMLEGGADATAGEVEEAPRHRVVVTRAPHRSSQRVNVTR